MIDLKAAAEYGEVPLTDQRLRDIFSAVPDKDVTDPEKQNDLYKLRTRLEDRLSDKVETAISQGLANYKMMSAVDLAWDSSPINDYNLPLIMYAQGRLTVEQTEQLASEFPKIEGYIQRTKKGVRIDLPKFFDVNINLVRSYITRRLAAQLSKYDDLSPFFKYHPRLQTEIGRLRADILSERVDMMSDQYGYRKKQEQLIRGMMLYQKQFGFVSCKWESDKYIDENGNMIVYREGIDWTVPHPTRSFYDTNYPASSLLTDTGCRYCGYWEVTPLGEIIDNPHYFNKDQIMWGDYQDSLFRGYQTYWSQYTTKIVPPSVPMGSMTEKNHREGNGNFYAIDDKDRSVFLTQFFWKVVPSEEGIADYDFPCWIRLVIAGDRTVVYAEVMPSSPCTIFEYNGHDGRLNNLSIAHEIMPYQDQVSNLFSQLLETIKSDLMSVGILNTDVFDTKDPEQKSMIEEFKQIYRGESFKVTRAALAVSFQKLNSLSIPIDNVFKVVHSAPNHSTDKIFQSIRELLNILDRLLALSPQELGQIAPREVTATEVAAVSNTTESVYAHISTGIDQGRDTMKRIIFEAAKNCISDKVEVSIKTNYPKEVVEAAGFSLIEDESQYGTVSPDRVMNLTGPFKGLIHQYTWTSRDGSERVNNVQAAGQLINLVNIILTSEMLMQKIPPTKIFTLMNFAVRSLGTGYNLNLQIDPESENTFSNEQRMLEALNNVAPMFDEIAQNVEGNRQSIDGIIKVLQTLGLDAGAQQSAPAQDVQQGQPMAAGSPQLLY